MPRMISFSMTTPQFIAGTKDVTRRMGWRALKAGDELMAVEKAMGLGKGGKVKRLGMIRVKSVRREPLNEMCADLAYGAKEVIREGFPHMDETEFVLFFCDGHKGCKPSSIVTRIEFEKLPLTSRPCEHAAIIGLDGKWHCQKCAAAIEMATAQTSSQR